jgi:hypothetical protein
MLPPSCTGLWGRRHRHHLFGPRAPQSRPARAQGGQIASPPTWQARVGRRSRHRIRRRGTDPRCKGLLCGHIVLTLFYLMSLSWVALARVAPQPHGAPRSPVSRRDWYPFVADASACSPPSADAREFGEAIRGVGQEAAGMCEDDAGSRIPIHNAVQHELDGRSTPQTASPWASRNWHRLAACRRASEVS